MTITAERRTDLAIAGSESEIADFPPIIAEGRQWFAIDKPAGLAVHPGPRTPHSLEQILADHAGTRPPPQPAHRLDRDTSGCLLIARRPAALRRLMRAFAEGAVHKHYVAIVENPPADDSGRIVAALAKFSTREQGWRMQPAADGKPAATGWRILHRNDRLALVLFTPESGRTHQIRVHATLMADGAAIVGDPVYGRAAPGGMMLHAHQLAFPDPDGGPARITVTAPLPARFAAAGFRGLERN